MFDEIRSDIADYYFEVERFDADISNAIQLLDSLGELDNTIIVCNRRSWDAISEMQGQFVRHGCAGTAGY